MPKIQEAVSHGISEHIQAEHSSAEHSLTQHRMNELSALLKSIEIFQQKYVFDILFVLSGMTELYFNEIRRDLDHINPTTLTKRLKHLEANGIIERIVHAGQPVRVSYRLTALGNGSFGLLLPLLVYVEYFEEFQKLNKEIE